jgi:hypothetical protein
LSHAKRLGDGKLFLDSFNDQAVRWIPMPASRNNGGAMGISIRK